jgi:hypothetical protein
MHKTLKEPARSSSGTHRRRHPVDVFRNSDKGTGVVHLDIDRGGGSKEACVVAVWSRAKAGAAMSGYRVGYIVEGREIG